MPIPRYTPDEAYCRAKEIYDTQIRAQAEEEHFGQYIVIDVDTGEYQIGTSQEPRAKGELAKQMHSKNPDAHLFAFRIGYCASAKWGGGWSLERDDCRAGK